MDLDAASSTTNLTNIIYTLLALLLILTVHSLKDKYYEWSTGDYTKTERKVQYARKISNAMYERQKAENTQREVQKLKQSTLYQQKISALRSR